MQKEIRLQEFQFFRQRYQCFILTLQNITVYTGQMLGEMNSITRVIFYFSNQRIETIKQKMGDSVDFVKPHNVQCRSLFAVLRPPVAVSGYSEWNDLPIISPQ